MQFEISIEGPPHALRALQSRLGGPSPVLQPLPSDGDDPRTRMVLMVDGPEHLDRRMIALSAALGDVERAFSTKSLYLRVRNLAYSEPPGATPHFAEPFHPIPRLTIRPDSHPLRGASDAGIIFLDPGHAFGTGKHPSTVLCLQAIQQMADGIPSLPALRTADVLDFGCGTGLLAIAVVKMGARGALGIEIDPDSAETARRNVMRNGLSDRIEIRQGSWEVVHGRYNVIVANLVPAALLGSLPHLHPRLRNEGLAIVSGFGLGQAEGLKTRLESSGLLVSGQLNLEGWAAFVAHRGARHADS